LAATRRTALLHASWRPALAGAAGAALVIAVVYVALPKFTVREVTVDHVNVVPKGGAVDHIITHDITVYHIITHEVTINNPVPHDVPFNVPVPRIVQPPMPPIASAPSDAPTTPEEKRFVGSPEYQSAIYRGRIVSTDGRAISFADGKNFHPAHWDGSQIVDDQDRAYDTAAYVGDLAMCVQDANKLWECKVMHNSQELYIYQTAGRPA
jgi:hypothetical protein